MSSREMGESPGKELHFEDYIRASRDMDGQAYLEFMELPYKQREDIARDILQMMDDEPGGSI